MAVTESPVPATDVVAGRYILATHIGSGSTATVYRAWDPPGNRAVAVKLLLDRCDVTGLNRQRRELRAMQHLSHPSLARLLDGGVDTGRPYLVSELVEGQTLAARLDRGPLTVQETAQVGVDIASGLAHLHARGVVHRNIKPANIFLCSRTGRARLADFGSARVMGYTALTQLNALLGAASYLAPEQVTGEAVTPAVDVYALALVLLEAHTGHREYPGDTMESAMDRLHRPPRIPDTLPDHLRHALFDATYQRAEERLIAADMAIRLQHRR